MLVAWNRMRNVREGWEVRGLIRWLDWIRIHSICNYPGGSISCEAWVHKRQCCASDRSDFDIYCIVSHSSTVGEAGEVTSQNSQSARIGVVRWDCNVKSQVVGLDLPGVVLESVDDTWRDSC